MLTVVLPRSSTLSPRSRSEGAVSYFGRVSLLNLTWATQAYKQQVFQQAHRLAVSHTEKVACPQVKAAQPGIPSFPVLQKLKADITRRVEGWLTPERTEEERNNLQGDPGLCPPSRVVS